VTEPRRGDFQHRFAVTRCRTKLRAQYESTSCRHGRFGPSLITPVARLNVLPAGWRATTGATRGVAHDIATTSTTRPNEDAHPARDNRRGFVPGCRTRVSHHAAVSAKPFKKLASVQANARPTWRLSST
jgi:hypothetical protein